MAAPTCITGFNTPHSTGVQCHISITGTACTRWGFLITDTVTFSTYDLHETSGGTGGTGFTDNMIQSGLVPGRQYKYQAYATNGDGTGWGSELNFDMLQVPEMTTDGASSITKISAILTGNLTYGATFTYWGFDYGKTLSYGLTGARGTNTGTGSFSLSITGLDAGTLYYYRTKANNTYGSRHAEKDGGAGSWVDDVGTFTTFPATAPTVSTQSPSSILTTSARLNGYVTDSGGQTCTVAFEYGKTSSYELGTLNAGTVPSTGGSFNFDKSGLDVGTRYYFRAKVTNSVTTAYGSIISFYTATPTVVATVSTVAATAVGDHVARMNANVIATGGENPTRYIEYGKTTSYELGPINVGVGGTGAYYVDLTGLDASTLYYFKAYATNSAGVGWGGQLTFTTTGLPVTSTSAASSLNSLGATLNGLVSDQGSSTVSARGFQYGLTTGYGTNVGVGSGLGSFSAAISGLKSGNTYHYRTYAINSDGTSYGSDVTFIPTESRIVLSAGKMKTRAAEGTIVKLVNGKFVTGTPGDAGELVLFQGQLRTQPS